MRCFPRGIFCPRARITTYIRQTSCYSFYPPAPCRVGPGGGAGPSGFRPPPASSAPAPSPSPLPSAADDDVDPLDAYMQREIAPEMDLIQEEERRRREEERKFFKEMAAKGKLPKWLEEDEPDVEEPDAVIKVPSNKVKRLVGAGGAKIKEIEARAKCRLQIMKTEDELQLGLKGQVQQKEQAKLEVQIRAQKAIV